MTCLVYLKSGGKPGSKEVFAGKFSPTKDSMLIGWTRAVVRGGEVVVVEARVTLTKTILLTEESQNSTSTWTTFFPEPLPINIFTAP